MSTSNTPSYDEPKSNIIKFPGTNNEAIRKDLEKANSADLVQKILDSEEWSEQEKINRANLEAINGAIEAQQNQQAEWTTNNAIWMWSYFYDIENIWKSSPEEVIEMTLNTEVENGRLITTTWWEKRIIRITNNEYVWTDIKKQLQYLTDNIVNFLKEQINTNAIDKDFLISFRNDLLEKENLSYTFLIIHINSIIKSQENNIADDNTRVEDNSLNTQNWKSLDKLFTNELTEEETTNLIHSILGGMNNIGVIKKQKFEKLMKLEEVKNFIYMLIALNNKNMELSELALPINFYIKSFVSSMRTFLLEEKNLVSMWNRGETETLRNIFDTAMVLREGTFWREVFECIENLINKKQIRTWYLFNRYSELNDTKLEN